MKNIRMMGVAGILMVFNLNCVSIKQIPIEHNSYISFGSMGGFAGSYNECRILPDGTAFRRSKFKGKYKPQLSLDKKQTNQLYKHMNMLYELDIDLNDPGNLTYFLIYSEKGHKRVEYIWGGDNMDVEQIILDFYNLMKDLCKDDNPVR